MSSPEPPIVQPWLRFECGDLRGFLQPDEAASVRDVLQARDELAAKQLAALIDSAVMTLQASPLHAGTRAIGITAEERLLLLQAADALEQSPSDRYAKLRLEFSG